MQPDPQSVKSTCPYCGVGCGIIAQTDKSGGAVITGDKTHPANFGQLCVKGSALGETLGLEGRLLYPLIHGQRTSWNRALNFIAEGLQATIARHGRDAIAFYLSGQMLTEDYYVANKFAKGFIGTPHVDTNSRLCMASSVAGHRRAFGSDTVPNTYEDIDTADLIILAGSNAAWCHPILYRRMQAARGRGARLINIDPRRTATSEGADLQLSVKPGTDSILFSWLLTQLSQRGHLDDAYIARHTTGFDAALRDARDMAPSRSETASACGIAASDLDTFVDWFITTPRTLTCYSQGVNQAAQGTDKVNAILNCHLATARIGKAGSGPFSLTGQPNAMGGREVGGLANMLAAHMSYTASDIDRVRRFWAAPNIAQSEGLKAVDMFEAIESGRIRALWVMHTNPLVSLPRASAMREALRKLDLFIVSEAAASTDTTAAGPHVTLPAAAWGEKSGTVTNSERRISRQRAFLAAPGEALPDWQHICGVAKRLGYEEAFSFPDEAAIFREHAALSGFENQGTRDFDISACADMGAAAYGELSPFHWPHRRNEKPQQRFFAEGGFYTPDNKARFVAVAPVQGPRTSDDYPLVLNTGRMRDHWHTMTRTGLSPRLARHSAAAALLINPADAVRRAIADGDYARVSSTDGAVTLKVEFDPGQQPGSLFAPIHWSASNSGLARIGDVVHSARDPISGQPDLKATPVRIDPLIMRAEGFLVSRHRQALPHWLQHSRIRIAGGYAWTFASPSSPAALYGLLANSLGEAPGRAQVEDAAREDFRTIVIAGDRLESALFVSGCMSHSALDQVIDQLAQKKLSAPARRSLLAGRALSGGLDLGPAICACFGVRRAQLTAAITGGANSLAALGDALKAGTNCGSCQPELRRLIDETIRRPAKASA